jgi:hypothetical protein
VALTCGANVNLDTCKDYYTVASLQLDQANALLMDRADDECGDGAINVAGIIATAQPWAERRARRSTR